MLLALALNVLAPARSLADAPVMVLSPDPCDPAYDLVVPAELTRTGLVVVAGAVEGAPLICFDLRPRSVAVTLTRDGEATAVAAAELPKLRRDAATILKCRPDGITVAAEGRTVCRAAVALPPGGRWGLRGADPALLEQITYQPVAEAVFTDDFMRGPDEAGGWTTLSGQWDVAALDSAEYSANAFLLSGRASGREPAATVAGDWFWEDYTAEVSVRVAAPEACFGLGLYAEAGVGHHLFRFNGAEGKFELVRVARAGEVVLASTPGTLPTGEWHRLSLSAVGNELAATADGVPCLAATDEGLAQGQALLWVAGAAPVEFDDVTVYPGPRPARRPVTLAYAADVADPTGRRFADDHYMEGWADERDQWRAASGPSVWHTGCFWGDAALTWEIDPAVLTDAVELHLGVPVSGPSVDPPADSTGGVHLRVAPTDGGLALTLRRDGEVRAEATAPGPPEGGSLTLRRSGGRCEALIGDEVVAAFTDATPAPGGKIGLTCRGAIRQPERLRITAWNVLDSAFRTAPTEWRVVGGEWNVQSRWACTPRWSWFGGRSRDLAAIWTREAYSGDVAVEFFAGFQMDTPYAPFYQHPSNIGVTLCGDGATPSSGYSFVVGAYGNRETVIFRRDEVVARTSTLRLPDILDSFGGGTVGETGAVELHKEWEHVRAERIGAAVRLLVDGKVALEYEDPEPLPGGAVGLWTLGNGLTVARARVYHQGAEPAQLPQPPRGEATALPALPLEVAQPDHVAETFEQGLRGWNGVEGTCVVSLDTREASSADRCLLAANARPGGPFVLRTPVRGLDLTRHPRLAFDYAIPPAVCVDAYLTVNGGRYRLRMMGPPAGPIGTEELGGFPELSSDGDWRHAEVDLLGRLRPFLPPDVPPVLEALEFANHAAPEYLHAGIGGNPLGAAYRLDNVFLGAPVEGPVTVRTPRGARMEAPDLLIGADGTLTPRRSGVLPIRATSGQRTAVDLIAFGGLPATGGGPVWREAPAATPAGATPRRWDFESDAGRLRPWGVGGGAAVRRTHAPALANPDGGNWCLEVVNTEIGGAFGLEIDSCPFPAAGYPVLSFDYCVPDTLRVDLLLEVNGTRRMVKFADNDATWPTIGSAAATTDAQWHHAAIDLHAMLRKAFPAAKSLTVTQLGFASSGWPGNRRGTTYWLDNVELHPSAETPQAEDAVASSPPEAVPPAPPPATYRPADCAVQSGFEGIAADDPAMWGNFLGCQVVRCAEGGATQPGCLELRDLRDANGSCFALIAQLRADWPDLPVLHFRYRTRRGSAARLTLRATTYDGTTDQWTVLATFPPAGPAWQDAEVDLATALRSAGPQLTMHRIFLDLAIPDPDDAVLIDDYALRAAPQ